jgi:hypothetical protein
MYGHVRTYIYRHTPAHAGVRCPANELARFGNGERTCNDIQKRPSKCQKRPRNGERTCKDIHGIRKGI